MSEWRDESTCYFRAENALFWRWKVVLCFVLVNTSRKPFRRTINSHIQVPSHSSCQPSNQPPAIKWWKTLSKRTRTEGICCVLNPQMIKWEGKLWKKNRCRLTPNAKKLSNSIQIMMIREKKDGEEISPILGQKELTNCYVWVGLETQNVHKTLKNWVLKTISTR